MGVVVFLLGCGGLLLGLSVGLLVGSIILRAAVALANRFLGPPKPPDTFGQWDDWDSDDPTPVTRKNATRAVPEPGLATGLLITFVLGVSTAVGYAVLGFIAGEVLGLDGPDEGLALVLIFLFGLPFTGFLLTFLLTLLLPTTFMRAMLVAFVHHFIFIVGVGAIGAVVVGTLFMLG